MMTLISIIPLWIAAPLMVLLILELATGRARKIVENVESTRASVKRMFRDDDTEE